MKLLKVFELEEEIYLSINGPSACLKNNNDDNNNAGNKWNNNNDNSKVTVKVVKARKMEKVYHGSFSYYFMHYYLLFSICLI